MTQLVVVIDVLHVVAGAVVAIVIVVQDECPDCTMVTQNAPPAAGLYVYVCTVETRLAILAFPE